MSETIENIETPQDYTPSSIEKKRATMMYLFFWIIITISKKQINSFEYFHLKQSIWWRLCFMLVSVWTIVLMLIPWLKYIAILALLAMVVCLIIFIKQTQDWKYYLDIKKYVIFGVFPSLGGRLVDLFELSPKETTTNDVVPTIDQPINIEQAAQNIQPQTSSSEQIITNNEQWKVDDNPKID